MHTPSRRILLLILAVALSFSLPSFFFPSPIRDSYVFEVTIQPTKAGGAQVYWDTGRGYSEEESSRVDMVNTSSPVVYRFKLPTGTYRGLRFDPVDNDKPVLVADAKIVSSNRSVIQRFPASAFQAEHDIARIVASDTGLLVEPTNGGTDPYLKPTLPAGMSLPIGAAPLHRLSNAVPIFIGVFLLGLCISIIPWQRSGINGEKWLLAGCVILTLAKLWLVSGETICALVDAGHDDQLFLNLAHNILGGRWLGNYSQFTLMKGSMYSIFIAGVFLLGIPLFTAQHLLYVAACGLVVRALRPFRLNIWLLLTLFAILLFNPVTYDTGTLSRIARQQLLPSLALIIVASNIGLYARRSLPVIKLVPWALILGVALPTFWMTREEGVWILPCVALPSAMFAFSVWRERQAGLWSRLALATLLPFCFWAGGVGLVSWLNYSYYGVFTTCEFKHRDFKAAYGALLRIESKEWLRCVSIRRETRERAYIVSPAFAELKPYLEGPIGTGWAGASVPYIKIPESEREIGDGFFMWALRDAVIASGHGNSGGDAMAFYAKIASEINDACDRGVIKAGPKRSGFLPPWRPEYTARVPDSLRCAVLFFVSFDQMSTTPQASDGAQQNYTRFQDLTRGRLTPPAGAPPIPPRQRWLDGIRTNILHDIQLDYNVVGHWACSAASLALIAALLLAIIRKRLSYFLVLSISLLGSCIGLVLICTIVDVTSFPAITTLYFTGGYGLWVLLVFTIALALIEILKKHPTHFNAKSSPHE